MRIRLLAICSIRSRSLAITGRQAVSLDLDRLVRLLGVASVVDADLGDHEREG
ncbi:hypothetical protein ACFVYA_36150 [Amycolatopsis sp. NPDC058278]|uniref:hypothetical protein n=1 Tax=Amycolatopsis sp. NPDC058278 TaxID=3346417 RepID=UPI0036DC9366